MLARDRFDLLNQEITAALAQRMRAHGLLLAQFPGLTDNASAKRTIAVLGGIGEGAVNLPSLLKKFVARTFPDFIFDQKTGDQMWFAKPLTADFRILLIFERIHHCGLGKAFTVTLGSELSAAGAPPVWWHHSLLSFFERERLEWTYGLAEDLEGCLQEVSVLLNLVLPEYEATWIATIDGTPSDILPAMTEYGAISFYEAADIAYRALEPLCPSFSSVIGAYYAAQSAFGTSTNTDHGRESAAASGRLAAGHAWSIQFADIPARRAIRVGVPFLGGLAFSTTNRITVLKNAVHWTEAAAPRSDETLTLPAALDPTGPRHRAVHNPSWHAFADSLEAIDIAAAAGARAFLHKHPKCTVQLTLYAEASEPPMASERWSIEYQWRSGFDQDHASFHISARDRTLLPWS